jgi:alanyl-tRNA synthetase
MSDVTERLYYRNPYAVRFDATVMDVEPLANEHAGRWGVRLDRTAFYPTSGGQPFDIGSLGAARVVDVIDEDAGTIVHVVEGDLNRGSVIQGVIDWTRRFDHMQQHTGQHVLSAAFDRLMQVRTMSFHLGSAASTIDLAREVSAAEIARAESEANRVVWEDRPVAIRFATADEAANLPLRKEPARDGVLRIIDIEDWDVSACGGTHVARTGAIGIIAVTASERFRGGTRVEFVCGGRALESFRRLRESVTSSTKLLSVLPADLPASIERLQSETREVARHAKALQSRLATHEAAALAAGAEVHGPIRMVVAALEGWDAAGLKAVAAAIAARPGHVAALLSSPAPSAIVVARAPDATIDCAAILKELTAGFGGKGGGRPELAQGGGLTGDVQAMLAAVRARLLTG